MEKTTHIYALTDPDTGDVRYVGKADNPSDRHRKHMLPSALAIRCRRTSWLKGLINAGKKPGMEVLETVPDSQWKERECYWIEFYRALGVNLVNTARGGTGGVKPEWVTAEWRAKQSKAQTGKKQSAESIAKMVATRVGVPRKPETIAKMSAAHKGKRPSAQCEAARLKAITGKKHSAEHKQKIGAASKGNRYGQRHNYICIDPTGIEYTIDRLSEFCKAHDLNLICMMNVAKARENRRQHKGWKCKYAE
jgi:hypothetical protein